MLQVQSKNKYFWFLSGFFVCSVILWYFTSDGTITLEHISSGKTSNVNKEGITAVNGDIADIFSPDGQTYKIKNGIIYHCITRELYSKVTPPHETRYFRRDTWAEPGEDPDARAKSFQSFFDLQKSIQGKQRTPQLDKFSSEYRSSGGGSTMEAAKKDPDGILDFELMGSLPIFWDTRDAGTLLVSYPNPMALLESLITRLKIFLQKPVITMVDIPCGDFYWMRHFVGPRTDIQYTGIDIVPTLIQRHKINFRNMTHAQFKNHDIVTAGLNQSYDVIFCRDMLQHLTNSDALKVLEHFSRSGSKLLITTNLISETNIDLNLKKTRYRHLNLMLSPVNLVPPICSMRDNVSNRFKDLAIWKLPLKQKSR